MAQAIDDGWDEDDLDVEIDVQDEQASSGEEAEPIVLSAPPPPPSRRNRQAAEEKKPEVDGERPDEANVADGKSKLDASQSPGTDEAPSIEAEKDRSFEEKADPEKTPLTVFAVPFESEDSKPHAIAHVDMSAPRSPQATLPGLGEEASASALPSRDLAPPRQIATIADLGLPKLVPTAASVSQPPPRAPSPPPSPKHAPAPPPSLRVVSAPPPPPSAPSAPPPPPLSAKQASVPPPPPPSLKRASAPPPPPPSLRRASDSSPQGLPPPGRPAPPPPPSGKQAPAVPPPPSVRSASAPPPPPSMKQASVPPPAPASFAALSAPVSSGLQGFGRLSVSAPPRSAPPPPIASSRPGLIAPPPPPSAPASLARPPGVAPPFAPVRPPSVPAPPLRLATAEDDEATNLVRPSGVKGMDATSELATGELRPVDEDDLDETRALQRFEDGDEEATAVRPALDPFGGQDDRTAVRKGPPPPALQLSSLSSDVSNKRAPSSAPRVPALAPPRAPSLPPRATSELPRLPPPAPVPSFGASSGVVAAGPHPPPRSRAPRSVPEPPVQTRSGSMPSIPPTTGSVPPLGRRSRLPVLAAAAAVLAAAVALFVAFRPTTGGLLVTVAGPNRTPIEEVSVFVDGVKRCDKSPCEITEIAAGMHFVRATAKGISVTAERAVVVERGARAAHHVELGTTRGDSGIRVAAEGTDLRVFLDGRDVGAPPVDLNGLEPGVHVVRVVGPGDTYQAYEETIELRSGEVRSLGPVRLKVQKGTLTLEAGPGAEGAQVWVDNQPISELPMVLDLAADKVHEVRASRPGHASFSEQVTFDGEGRRTVRVELAADVGGGGAVRAVRAVRSGRRQPAQKPAAPTPPAANAGAFLNFNSIPVSSVIVDGRPVGFTPVTNIAVAPGSHTIVFVHPELGRKITSATVEAGGRKTVAVRFQ